MGDLRHKGEVLECRDFAHGGGECGGDLRTIVVACWSGDPEGA